MSVSLTTLIRRFRPPSAFIWLWLLFAWAQTSTGADWPQWRGANRTAFWSETGILNRIPSTGLKVLWRAKVGMGFSSPVIAGGNVFVSDATLERPLVCERVHCLDADSGKLRWTHAAKHTAPDWFFSEDQARGPGSTPIVWKKKVYAMDLFGTVVCLDAVHGGVIWQRNLKEEFHLPGTSVDTSPLIEGDLLILMIGGKPGAGVVALDRNTGREVWRALEEPVTWSSPMIVEAGGVRQLIVWTQKSVSSLNPVTGAVFWREATSTGGSPGTAAVATPVFKSPHLLISGWMFQLTASPPSGQVLWPASTGVARRILSDTSTPAMLDEHVYGAKTGGEFVCLKISTGEEVWKTNVVTASGNGASVQITQHGSSSFLYNDRGELIHANLTPGGYEELGRTQLIEPTWMFGGRKVAWASPAFSRQNVYVRNDRELICVSMAGPGSRGAKSRR